MNIASILFGLGRPRRWDELFCQARIDVAIGVNKMLTTRSTATPGPLRDPGEGEHGRSAMKEANMRHWISLVFAGLMCTILLKGTPALGLELYVSPKGNDAGGGTKEAPFRTIERAREEVRKKVAAGLREPVTVFLRSGVYELSESLTFGPQDSGSEAFAVTYAAFPGETVVLSGGRRITNWKKDDKGRWTTDLPDVKSGKWFFRQLTVNDRRAVRARWPEADGQIRIATVSDGVTAFTFNMPLPKESLGGQDAEMVVYKNWSVSRALIVSSDEKQLVTATPVGWIGHGSCTTASPGKPVFIENARAFLDQPGEWFLDRATGVLTYFAADEEEPAKTIIIAPVLEHILKIAGTKGKPVRNLRFKGLRFEHTNFPLPSFGYSECQAAHYGPSMKEPTHVQPVAIECAYAEDCRFEGCRFAHLNASGIGFGPGCRKNKVTGCTIEDIGGNGVMVGWRGTGRLEGGAEGLLDADWADPADAPMGNEIANCVIQHCGADSRGGVGVFVAFSADTRIAHNEIHDLPYTGVSIGYRWNTTPTSQVRCVVEYNHIHDVMKMLADGSGIYTLGFQPGTVLRANHIHDIHRSAFAQGGASNNGFFIDEGSKGFLFERNVVYATPGGALRFNSCKSEWHEWKDNLFDVAVARRTKGKAGMALDASGGGGAFVEAPHAPALEPEQLTLEAWVFLTEVPGGEDPRRWIVNKNGNEWAEGHYALIVQGRQAGAYLNIGGGQGNMIEALSEKEVLKMDQWHHLAATYDGAALKVYCDGAPVASKAVNKKRSPGNGPLVIGRRVDRYWSTQFKGLIDEVRVYGRVLMAAEIAARANAAGEAAPDCVGAWDFNEAAGGPSDVEKAAAKAGLEPEFRKLLLGEK